MTVNIELIIGIKLMIYDTSITKLRHLWMVSVRLVATVQYEYWLHRLSCVLGYADRLPNIVNII